ncbi:MAG: hypothetical protein ACXVC7_09200 [Bacteroidia bacterium]
MLFVISSLKSQDTLKTFKLICGDQSKTVNSKQSLHLETQDGGKILGSFVYKIHNSIYLTECTQIFPDKTYKLSSENGNQSIPTEINQINRVIYERDAVIKIGGGTFWTSAITAVVISPLLSIKRGGGFDKNKCFMISGIAGGIALLSLGVVAVFGEKIFYLKTYKNKRIWTISN